MTESRYTSKRMNFKLSRKGLHLAIDSGRGRILLDYIVSIVLPSLCSLV